MANRKFTIEDGKEWRKRYENGETYIDIGYSCIPQISPETIRRWALRAGLTPRPPGERVNTKRSSRANATGATDLSKGSGMRTVTMHGSIRQGKRRHRGRK